jgi:hypothetical protein
MDLLDYDKISESVQEAIELGLEADSTPELKNGQLLLKEKQEMEDIKNELLAAVNVLRMKSETGILEVDLQPLTRSIDKAEKVCAVFYFLIFM